MPSIICSSCAFLKPEDTTGSADTLNLSPSAYTGLIPASKILLCPNPDGVCCAVSIPHLLHTHPWASGTFLTTWIFCGWPLPFPVEWLIPISVQPMLSAALQPMWGEFLLIILILAKYLLKALQHWDGNEMEGLGRPTIVSFTSL